MRKLTYALAALCLLVLTALFVQTGPEVLNFVLILLGMVLSFFLMAGAVLYEISRRKP